MSIDQLQDAYTECIERINDIYSAHPHGKVDSRAKAKVRKLQLQAFDFYIQIVRLQRWQLVA